MKGLIKCFFYSKMEWVQKFIGAANLFLIISFVSILTIYA